jgi:hypothetical protein
MKFPSPLPGAQSDAVLLGVAAVVFVGLVLFLKKQAGDALKAAADVNKGTAYEGAGVVGTLGNVTNQVSGGLLGNIGSWLGGAIFDATHSDPNLQTSKQAVGDNFFSDDSVLAPGGW